MKTQLRKIKQYLLEVGTSQLILDIVCKTLRFLYRGKSQNRIVILAVHRLGDSILTLPAIKYLSDISDLPVTVICDRGISDIYRANDIKAEFIEISFADFYHYRHFADIRNRIKSAMKNALVFDFMATKFSAYSILLTHVNESFGANHHLLKNTYTRFTEVRKVPELTDIYYDIIRLKIPSCSLKGNKIYPLHGRQIRNIAITLFAGWHAKQWGVFRFLCLAKRLSKEYSVKIILATGSLESEISETMARDVNVIFTDSINELSDFLRTQDFLIGPDTGTIHLASNLGLPTFTIYGPTSPEFSTIASFGHFTIRKKLFCMPEGNNYCIESAGVTCTTFDCMKLLSVEEVYYSVIQAIQAFHLERHAEIS